MKKLFLLAALAGAIYTADAQVTTPQPSPESTIMQKVGLTDVMVNYSRPSTKGRTIFGDLVPYNEMWRTGANGSTDIEFSTDVRFGGTPVKAGKYSIYSTPGANEWKVMLYGNTEHWGNPGNAFDEKLIVAQATAKPIKLAENVETFTIGFDDLRNDGANLTIAWANTLVTVPINVDSKTAVQSSIEKTLAGPSANDYNAAASFYLEENLDLEKAHAWSTKATELNPNAFWMLKVKSEIEAKMGKYPMAIKTATESMKKADKAGNAQYVKFNEENIAAWKKMN